MILPRLQTPSRLPAIPYPDPKCSTYNQGMSYLRRPNTGRPQLIHNNPYNHHQTTMEYKPYLLKEDNEQKIPLFLIKLWNIVEDPTYREVVRWDETGLSFHIMDPYAFCSNILPQYFKHKNLNSLVRQLNMYGFRKNTPLDRSGLNRAESDQDHLEFLHPYFRRDHPELLGNIKRKVPNKSSLTAAAIQQLQASGGDGTTVAVHTSDLSNIFDELKSLRDRQKGMEMRMEELTKENEMLWTEMAHIRGTHLKQQQIVNKLIQFLVALVAPGNKQQSRLGKRHMYVLEDGPGGSKRFRESAGGGGGGIGDLLGDGGSSSGAFGSGRSMDPSDGNSPATANNQIQSILPANASEILDRLINDITSSGGNFGSGNGAANFIFGHEQNHININNLTKHRLHRNAPTKIDPLIEDVDELRMMNTGNQHNRQQQQQLDPFLNNKQLQPYTGGGDSAARLRSASGSAGSLISTSSGPIIAEVTEDLDQFGADDISAGSGGGMFHVGGGRQQQPQLAVVVSSPVQTNVASPGSGEQQMQQRMGDATVGQQQNNFRGYSSSFGSTGTAPASKRAATYQQQQQPMRSTMTTVVPSQAQQQHPIVIYTPMSTAGSPPQQQQQQPLVIYSPITPVGSEPVTPQHQQQQVMMLQQMPMSQQQVQIHQQPRQCPTAPPNSNNFSYQQQQQRRGQQQQQPMQFVTAPSSGQQPQIGIGIDQQPNNSNSPLVAQPSSIGESPQSGTGLDVPLTEGMMLNEQEMAEIAGLNAFLEKANATLDENGTRFQTLSNSIGEHWNSVGVDPDDVDFHDLDLFDYDNSIGNEHATDGGESQLHGTQTTEGARYVRSPYNNEPRNFQDHGGHPGI